MLRAAVIEPNKNKRELIKACLADAQPAFRASEFSCAESFLDTLDEKCTAYDLVVMNTSIRTEGDGVRLASELRARNARLMLMFATDSEAYYAKAFELLVTGYLVYPFDYKHLLNAISFFFHSERLERRASIMLKETGGSYRRVYARHIKYIESVNREIVLHLEDGTTLTGYDKLAEAAQALPHDLFFRCHQSYLVNFYFTDSMQKDTFVIGDTSVPISRKYLKEAKEAYCAYVFRSM
ncbi:MAG: LytTR family DNA-binding domain-containing protein [Clostridia bacterium]|nr:LytTR family DNA-binding domain-containing protein [Clostridia bacterium]